MHSLVARDRHVGIKMSSWFAKLFILILAAFSFCSCGDGGAELDKVSAKSAQTAGQARNKTIVTKVKQEPLGADQAPIDPLMGDAFLGGPIVGGGGGGGGPLVAALPVAPAVVPIVEPVAPVPVPVVPVCPTPESMIDEDGDGFANCLDNCPDIPNIL